ncbi:MAG TPA: PH domain-containing protein [Anaerolineales bacterium]
MPKTYLESLLGDREKILLVAHQHWFILLNTMLAEIVFILILIALAVVGSLVRPDFSLIILPAAAILLIIPVIAIVRDILIWHNREYIISNLRVIQVSGMFNKNVIDSSLEKVNDVKMDQSVLGRMFNYGDVEILTASELGVNLFQRIQDPVRFKTTMLNAKERLEHEGSQLFADQTPKPQSQPSGPMDIPAMIGQLDSLRQKGILTEEEFQKKKAELLAKLS